MNAGSRGLRCLLFVPATRLDRFHKAASSGAGLAIIDLEDAVPPGQKESARGDALGFLRGNPNYALRVNPPDTMAGLADLHELLASDVEPELLVVPKVSGPEQLATLDRLLSSQGKLTGLIPMIESVQGLSAVNRIAQASSRIRALMIGAADLAADLGTEASWEPLAYARSRVIAAAALAGLSAIDSPFFDIGDSDGLAEETKRARAFGFEAKAAIHPRQIGVITEMLRPTDQQMTRARLIVDAAAKGVAVINGVMIDEAMAKKARRTLGQAEL